MSKRNSTHEVILHASNTNEYVIHNALVFVLDMNFFQAQQCSYLLKFNKVCSIFTGKESECRDVVDKLMMHYNLTSEIRKLI